MSARVMLAVSLLCAAVAAILDSAAFQRTLTALPPAPSNHLRSLGRPWTHLTVGPITAYAAYVVLVRGEQRWEMVLLLVVPLFIAFYSRKTRLLYDGVYPMLLTAVVYDAMRFVRDVGLSPGRVHVCDLRQRELDLFGISSGGVKTTLQEYFIQHSSRFADAYFAIPYGTFVYVSIAFAVYLFFRDSGTFRRYGWTFLVMNVAGYVTYHAYPAAPPWYYHAHGCAVDLTVPASEGPHLATVDAMMGFDYFRSFYGRSADVFGAMPSLHVAYPLVIVIEGWPLFRAPGRAASVLFSVSMIGAAVYLDHHWTLDVIAGLCCGLGVHLALRRVLPSTRRRTSRLDGTGSFTSDRCRPDGPSAIRPRPCP